MACCRPKHIIFSLIQHMQCTISNVSCLTWNCFSFYSSPTDFDFSICNFLRRTKGMKTAKLLWHLTWNHLSRLYIWASTWSVVMFYMTSLLLWQCFSLIECWGSCCCCGNVPCTVQWGLLGLCPFTLCWITHFPSKTKACLNPVSTHNPTTGWTQYSHPRPLPAHNFI